MNIFMRWKNFTLDEIFPIESKLFFIIVPSHHSSTVRNTETKNLCFYFIFKITVHDFVVVAKLFFLWCFLPSWMMLKIYIFCNMTSKRFHSCSNWQKTRHMIYDLLYLSFLKKFCFIILIFQLFFLLYFCCACYMLWIDSRMNYKEMRKRKKRRSKKKKSINPLIFQFTLNEKYKEEVIVQQS